jgi:large subunit ribosomal protein L37Ae
MAKKASLGSAKRFGTRYGRSLKERFVAIEKLQRAEAKCPYCKRVSAKQKAVGIFECSKCGRKFTGKAFTVA